MPRPCSPPVGKPALRCLMCATSTSGSAKARLRTGRISARQGRIPGAVWLEWYRMMKPTAEGPRFKSKNEILAECATVGISESTPSISTASRARGVEHVPRTEERGREGCPDVFRLLERMSRDPSLPIEEGLPTETKLNHQGGVTTRLECCSLIPVDRTATDHFAGQRTTATSAFNQACCRTAADRTVWPTSGGAW